MKSYTKYIFDLDYTLLIPDWSKEDNYLRRRIPKEECIMIGDSIKSDKDGAENAGIDSYVVDKNHTLKKLLEQIKKEAYQYTKKD